ncbi:MAG: membrane protein insertase YidC, partial [Thermoanaerobaculum sp.]|nr:membrane protein insertase YidC [Thermoanaerobaculum sp.]
MEKRALLAVVLSVVVVVVWYSLFPPRPPQPGVGEQVVPKGAGEGVLGAGVEQVRLGMPGEAIRAAREEEVVLEGEGFRAVVSNQGGVIRSWRVLAYRDQNGEAQELVGDGLRPLSLVPDGVWNQEPYVVERVGQGLVLKWADGQGRVVEKRLAPEGKYGLRVEVRAEGLGPEVKLVAASRLATWGGEAGAAGLARADLVLGVGGKVKRVGVGKAEQEGVAAGASFVGAEDHYFLLAFLPDGEGAAQVEGAEARALVAGRGVWSGLWVGLPKEHKLLKSFGRGLEETLSFGFFGFLSLLFLEVLRWIHGWSGNWGVGIVVLTALIRLLLFPLTHKSTVAMRGMARLQPKIKAIQERYQERIKRDPAVRQRMNQEIMELYRREGVNPMGGCLPLLVQIPILWALYTLFAYAIELRHQPFIFWIRDLSAKDPTYITPILMTASMVLQQRLAPQTGDPAP